MAKPKEEKLDFLRNIGGFVIMYLRVGNDKTQLEDILRMMLEAIHDELKRLGLSGESMPSLPDSKSKPRKSDP